MHNLVLLVGAVYGPCRGRSLAVLDCWQLHVISRHDCGVGGVIHILDGIFLVTVLEAPFMSLHVGTGLGEVVMYYDCTRLVPRGPTLLTSFH